MVDEKTYNEMVLSGVIALTRDWLGSRTDRLDDSNIRTAVGPMAAAFYSALTNMSAGAPKTAAAGEPAVPVKKSVYPDYLVCLDDGKQFRSLKRHLATLGMTPAEYRAKWGLPADYPMVAPSYSAQRSKMAKSFGLGRK